MVPSWQTAAEWTRAGICRSKRHEQLLFYTCGGERKDSTPHETRRALGGTRAGNDSLSPQRARVRSPASSTGLSRAEGAWAQRWWRDGSVQVSVLNTEHGRSTIYLNKYLFKKERKPVFIQLLHLLAHKHTSSVTPARVGYTCILIVRLIYRLWILTPIKMMSIKHGWGHTCLYWFPLFDDTDLLLNYYGL